MKTKLPLWVIRLLRLISQKEDFEYFLGDLEEMYQERYRQKKGTGAMRLFLLRHLFSLVDLRVILKKLFFVGQTESMWRFNLKLSLRNFARHRGYALTSLTMLSLGLFTVLVIALFATYELSFDRYHEHSESIYRTQRHVETGDDTFTDAMLPAPLAAAAQLEIGEIERWARLCKFREAGIFRIDEQTTYNEPRYIWADNDLLKLLKVEVLDGELSEALSDPGDLVITESTALKFFGTAYAVNKTLEFRTGFHEDVTMRVTAVIKDLPPNTHLQFDLINSFKTLETAHFRDIINNWDINYYYHYLQLGRHADLASVESRLNTVLARNVESEADSKTTLSLQPITDIYLNPLGEGWLLGPSSDKRYLYFFFFIAVLVLVMSAINYVSLATVRSAKRAGEIGMHKVIGASGSQVFWQHMTESLMLSLLASMAAIGLVNLILPTINQAFDLSINADLIMNWEFFVGFFAVALVIGLLSGLYPSIILSSYKTTEVIKAGRHATLKFRGLRNVLVLVQFVASIIVLMSSVLVYQQLRYVRQADLGFDQEQLIIFPLGTLETISKFDLLKTNLEQHSSVVSFSAASQFIGGNQLFKETFELADAETGEIKGINSVRFGVEHDFLRTLSATLAAGRHFNRQIPTDLNEAIMVNEAFMRQAGLSDYEAALGQQISVDFNWGERLELKLIGVVEDFHLQSMKSAVEPAAFYIRPDEYMRAHVKINTTDMRQALTEIENTVKSIAPELAFDFSFQDDQIASLYQMDRKMERALYYLTIITVLIAALGLFSLAVFIAQQQRKEMGIRKVLGASSKSIALKFSWYFIKLILLGLVVAVPLAFWLMQDWLNGFAFRMKIRPETFILVSGSIFLLVLVSVGLQVYRISKTNPVNILRNQ